jgi:integrase
MTTHQAAARDPRLNLHKATGRGRVILSGQHFYTQACHGTPESYQEYLDLLARWKANGKRPLRAVQTPLELAHPQAVADLFTAYERHLDATKAYVKDGRPTTQRDLIRIALREFAEHFGSTSLRALRAAELVRHRDLLRQRERLTTQGINRKIGLIKQAIQWGVERGLVTELVGASVITMRRLKAPRRPRRPAVDDTHIDAALHHLSPTLTAMVSLQRLTGMRPGEVCALRWRDIDKSPPGAAGDRGFWVYRVAGAKADRFHETVYHLNKSAQAVLANFIKPPGAFIFAPRDTVKQRWPGGAPDLLASAGDRYTTPAYRQAIERACRAAKVPVFGPHAIRHRFLTDVANDATLGLAAAAEAANHSSQTTTLRYVHPDPALAVKVAEMVDRRRAK